MEREGGRDEGGRGGGVSRLKGYVMTQGYEEADGDSLGPPE